MMGHMVDSDAVRSRRKRQHAQGDHSMCRHRLVPVPAEAGTAFPADRAHGRGLDPVEGLRELADRLAGAYLQDRGNAAIARELRMTLQALIGLPGEDPVDPLDELRAMMGPSLTP
jgi:hypothetical protein